MHRLGRYERRPVSDGDMRLVVGASGDGQTMHGSRWNGYLGTDPSPLEQSAETNPFGAPLAVVRGAAALQQSPKPKAVAPTWARHHCHVRSTRQSSVIHRFRWSATCSRPGLESCSLGRRLSHCSGRAGIWIGSAMVSSASACMTHSWARWPGGQRKRHQNRPSATSFDVWAVYRMSAAKSPC